MKPVKNWQVILKETSLFINENGLFFNLKKILLYLQKKSKVSGLAFIKKTVTFNTQLFGIMDTNLRFFIQLKKTHTTTVNLEVKPKSLV